MSDWPPRLIATARAQDDGFVERSTGIVDITHPITGEYVIQLKNEYQSLGNLHVSVGPYAGAKPPIWKWSQGFPPADTVTIEMIDTDGVPVDSAFTIRIYRDG